MKRSFFLQLGSSAGREGEGVAGQVGRSRARGGLQATGRACARHGKAAASGGGGHGHGWPEGARAAACCLRGRGGGAAAGGEPGEAAAGRRGRGQGRGWPENMKNVPSMEVLTEEGEER